MVSRWFFIVSLLMLSPVRVEAMPSKVIERCYRLVRWLSFPEARAKKVILEEVDRRVFFLKVYFMGTGCNLSRYEEKNRLEDTVVAAILEGVIEEGLSSLYPEEVASVLADIISEKDVVRYLAPEIFPLLKQVGLLERVGYRVRQALSEKYSEASERSSSLTSHSAEESDR